jgi:hypothetical protein
MRKKIIKKLRNLLIALLYKLEQKSIQEEMDRRISTVGGVIYTYLPTLLQQRKPINPYEPEIEEELDEITVIEGGSFNYYNLPSGTIPKFHFVCPSVPLYVFIGGPESASLSEAKALGISSEAWHSAAGDLTIIEQVVPSLAQKGEVVRPLFIAIRWDEPCTTETVLKRIQEAVNAA